MFIGDITKYWRRRKMKSLHFLAYLIIFNFLLGIQGMADTRWEYTNSWKYLIDGVYAKNQWIEYNNNSYYFDNNGNMATETYIDGFYVVRTGKYISGFNTDEILTAVIDCMSNGYSKYFVCGKASESVDEIHTDLGKIIEVLLYVHDIPVKTYRVHYMQKGDTIECMLERISLRDTTWNKDRYSSFMRETSRLAGKLNTIDDIINYVCDRNKYADSYTEYTTDNSAYNCLFGNGKTQCYGYAVAFSWLLRAKGIKSRVVFGHMDSNIIYTDKYENHAWNKVLIDGKWYDFDLTNYDANNRDSRYLMMKGATLSDYTPTKQMEY